MVPLALWLLLAAAQAGYDAALDRYRAGRFAESQAVLERLVAEGSRDARDFSLLAWCHHRQGRPDQALAAIRRAIELAPDEAAWYNHAAQILLENRSFEAAYRTAAKALELDPKSAQALKLKGRLELERGANRQAAQSFERAAALDPRDPEALLWLGTARQALWQYKEASAVFEKGIAGFPGFASLYAAYGRLLLEPGIEDETRAAALLEKALALNAALPQAHYDLGKLRLDQGKIAEAVRHLELAAKLDPRGARNHLALAEAYRLAGRSADQARELEIYRKLAAP